MDNVLSFSAIVDFTMPEKKSKDFQCGLEPNVDLSNQTRYSGTLRKGQEFMAGDFAVRVLEATGTDTFTGKAWIKVPYLGPMRIAVEFKDIQLNTDLQLMAGEVKTTYDPEWKNVLDINEAIGDVKEVAEAIGDLTGILEKLTDALNSIKELLNKDKIDNKKQYEAAWAEHLKIIDKQKELLFQTGNLPDHVKEEIKKLAGNSFLASTDKSKPPTPDDVPKVKDEVAALDKIKNKIVATENGLKKLIEALNNFGTDAFIKCKQCKGQKTIKLGGFDGSTKGYQSFSYYNERYICLIASLKADKSIAIFTNDLSTSSDKIAIVNPYPPEQLHF
jgi:hypothetical protein